MKRTWLTIATLAGSTWSITTPGHAGPPIQGPKQNRARAVLSHTPTLAVPTEYRRVRLVNGRIDPLGEWMPYSPTVGDVGTQTLCFDGYHTVGGNPPNVPPGAGRWTFTWTFTPPGIYDYTASAFATPINSILPAAIPIGAKYFDFVFYENQGPIDSYTTIFTAESYSESVAPDATWGISPGWQFHYTGLATGPYYSNLALTDPNTWPLPVDGSGAVITRTTRDAAGLIPAQGYQVSQWGTQEHTTPAPAPAKVGTSGPRQWADQSTGAVCATNLATNIADGTFQVACENFSWDYGPSYQPQPMTLCIALGFDAPASCYANCDGSTGSPALTANDFQCFANAYAAGQSSANCDGSTGSPALTANDFQCFANAYAAGCS